MSSNNVNPKQECLMTTKIFVNLPVKDLARSMGFFEKLGFRFNPQFTDETAACMVISDDIYAMLLTHPKFKEFTSKEIVDATKATEVLTALSADSKAKVDELVDAGLAAGATAVRDPMDFGFMYARSFSDLDGHIWEVFWMDPSHVQQG
jgi:predicted lactoylglutathione lyase